MNTIFRIATDNIRALLHQRLLLGLMLASLALTAFFSFTMARARTGITQSFAEDETVTNSPAVTNVTIGVGLGSRGLMVTNSLGGTNSLSATDRRKFREAMDSATSFMQAAFYGVASFGGSVVALFIFSTAVAAEIRKGTIRLTLSKPVSRNQFLLGKYLGGVMVMAGYALIASLAMIIFAHTQQVELNPALKWAPWLMFCRQLMLGSLAMLLSIFMHPILVAVLAFFAGNGLCSLHNPLYYLLPSYQDFNVFSQVLQGDLINGKDVFFLSLYAADFVIIMLLLALWRFRTKELV